MQTNELADLEAMARALAGQNLRSKAILLERLVPLIDRANALGHPHSRIHEVLREAGIDLTYGVYKSTLGRARQRMSAHGQPAAARGEAVGSGEPTHVGSPDPKEHGSHEPTGSHDPKGDASAPPQESEGNVMEVRDALKEAQKVSQTDYRKLARRNRT